MAEFLTFTVVGFGFMVGLIVLGLFVLVGFRLIDLADKLLDRWVHK